MADATIIMGKAGPQSAMPESRPEVGLIAREDGSYALEVNDPQQAAIIAQNTTIIANQALILAQLTTLNTAIASGISVTVLSGNSGSVFP